MSESDSKTPAAIALPELLAGQSDTAMALAHKHRLVAEDGQLYCWACNRLGGLLPSLHCAKCLEEHREREALQRAREAVEHPDNKRWRAIFRDIETRSGMDRETAEKVIRHAEGLPGATEERKRQLWRIYETRFGRREQSAPSWSGRGFRRSGTDE